MASSEEMWQLFVNNFGPVKTLAESLDGRREEFHLAWVEFFDENYGVDGRIEHAREWLLVTGTRR